MSEHVVVLATHDRDALGNVRTLPGLRVGTHDQQLWLRGLPSSTELPVVMRTLPAVSTYVLDAQNRLFPAGSQTPTTTLPTLTWQPIEEFMPLELPTAALPAQHPPRYRVRLTLSSRAEVGAALLTSLEAWCIYAETAPAIRLHGLRFAVSGARQVLLLGAPLPPLPGQEYWQQAGLLLPAGYDLEVPLLAPLLTSQLTPDSEALVLFTAEGSWELVPLAHLMPATRNAVRLTTESFRHG